MPIYDYKCEDCGREIEKIVSIKDSHRFFICKECLGVMKKQISLFSFKVNGYNAENNYSKGKNE